MTLFKLFQVINYSPSHGILYEFMLPSNVSFTSLSDNDNSGQSQQTMATQTPSGRSVHTQDSRAVKGRVSHLPVYGGSHDRDSVDVITNPNELALNRGYYTRKVRHRQRPTYVPTVHSAIGQRQELRGRPVGRRYGKVKANSTATSSRDYIADNIVESQYNVAHRNTSIDGVERKLINVNTLPSNEFTNNAINRVETSGSRLVSFTTCQCTYAVSLHPNFPVALSV